MAEEGICSLAGRKLCAPGQADGGVQSTEAALLVALCCGASLGAVGGCCFTPHGQLRSAVARPSGPTGRESGGGRVSGQVLSMYCVSVYVEKVCYSVHMYHVRRIESSVASSKAVEANNALPLAATWTQTLPSLYVVSM